MHTDLAHDALDDEGGRHVTRGFDEDGMMNGTRSPDLSGGARLLLLLPLFLGLFLIPAVVVQAQPVDPSEFLGYELGDRFTIWEAMEDYYAHVASESPRVHVAEYGRSVHGRRLPVLFVSSEENLANREQIRLSVKELTDRTAPLPEAELEGLLSDTPAIIWIFILDAGNEIAGPEVVMELIHELAVREDAAAQQIRDNLLIAIAPMTNPDAHVKYVNWTKLYGVRGSSVFPDAIQNSPHWGISSDGNAFGIDMNRDFTWFTVPETQALARFGVHWNPQVILDLHTGPLTFFMTPTGPPYHPLWPEENLKWSRAVVERADDRFRERHWLISTGMQYAGITYLGHGLTWGLLGPATTGQFVESFGGVNPERRRPDGTVATLRDAMDRTGLATLSMLEVASERREELLRDAYEVVQRSAEEAAAHSVRTVLIPAEGEGVDPAKVERLVDRLSLQGIRVERATAPVSADAAAFMDPDHSTPREFSAGTFVVDLVQPYSRLARALLDPTLHYDPPVVDPHFSRESPFYDAQVEKLPLLFGVPAYAVAGPVDVPTEPYDEGDGVATSALPEVRNLDAVGYVLPAGFETSARIATTLMEDGYRLRVARAPFRLNGRTHGEGTWVALTDRNAEDLGDRIYDLAAELGGEVLAGTRSGTEAGVTLANPSLIAPVPQPRIAVLADSPVPFAHVFGGIRNTLEWELDVSFIPISMETLNSGNLGDYTVVVLPDGGGYGSRLDFESLRRYVQGGGTVVAVKRAAQALASDSVLGRGLSAEGRANYIYGASLRAAWHDDQILEPGEWVEWEPGIRVGRPLVSGGLPREFAAPANQPVLFSTEEDGGVRVLASYISDLDRLQLDGFLWEPEMDEVGGRPFTLLQSVGAGQVLYFADDPTYRSKWYGLNLVFLNSLVLGPLM